MRSGGETRAKYGDMLIVEYINKLEKDLKIKYSTTSFKRMRKFYLLVEKGAPIIMESLCVIII